MTSPLPARPQGIRTSPDGFTVAARYKHGWTAFTIDDRGAIIRLDLLADSDVVHWDEWSPPPVKMPPPRTDARAKTVQDVVDGLPPGTEVT